MYKSILLFAFLLILGLSSCASYRTIAVRPESQPLGKEFAKLEPGSESSTESEFKGTLSLRDALSLALTRNPGLAVFSYEMRIQEANALQASLFPNPELDAEVENFAGSSSLNGFQGSEFTLSVGQLIELGGKRQKRTQVAVLGADLAAWDYEAAKLNIFVDVVTMFTEVLVVQQRINLQNELVNVAEAFLQTIQQRVKAGRVSPAEAIRAKVVLSTTKIDLERLYKELQSARKRLAATWGSIEPQFDSAIGNLDTVFSLPALEQLYPLISKNPDIGRWAVEMQQRDAELALEKAQRIPDPVIGGGYRRLNESGDNAIVMGISLPLLFFDRNKGNIQAAEYRKLQVAQQKRAVEIVLNTRLAEIYNTLSASYNEITTLRKNVIPEAKNAFDLINKGYLMGKFGFLEVLDTQRTLFEVRSQHLNVLKEYHQDVAKMERLIGQKLSDIR